MKQLKRTYALPENTVSKFESEVQAGQRSGVIATLMDQYLEEKRKEELRRDIDEGCKAMWDEYLEIQREFHAIDQEALRAIEY